LADSPIRRWLPRRMRQSVPIPAPNSQRKPFAEPARYRLRTGFALRARSSMSDVYGAVDLTRSSIRIGSRTREKLSATEGNIFGAWEAAIPVRVTGTQRRQDVANARRSDECRPQKAPNGAPDDIRHPLQLKVQYSKSGPWGPFITLPGEGCDGPNGAFAGRPSSANLPELRRRHAVEWVGAHQICPGDQSKPFQLPDLPSICRVRDRSRAAPRASELRGRGCFERLFPVGAAPGGPALPSVTDVPDLTGRIWDLLSDATGATWATTWAPVSRQRRFAYRGNALSLMPLALPIKSDGPDRGANIRKFGRVDHLAVRPSGHLGNFSRAPRSIHKCYCARANCWASAWVSKMWGATWRSVSASPSFSRMNALVV
jgi:hypothetical protein